MVETKNRGIGTSITIISPLIWVKQAYTTHLGMVYTIYKHADEGGGSDIVLPKLLRIIYY